MFRKAIITLFLAALCIAAPARENVFKKALDKYEDLLTFLSKINGSYYRDTAYIFAYPTKWAVKTSANFDREVIVDVGEFGGERFRASVQTPLHYSQEFALSFYGVTLAGSLVPPSKNDSGSDSQIAVRYFGNRIGFEFYYQYSNAYSGKMYYGPDTLKVNLGQVSCHSKGAEFYYALNYRNFSYPAGMSQTYVQKKSAGSVILALSAKRFKFHSDAIAGMSNPAFGIESTSAAFEGGYGYNYVPHPQWLFHASLIAGPVFFNHSSLTANGKTDKMALRFPNFMARGMVAAVYRIDNFSFAANAIIDDSSIGDDRFQMVSNLRLHFTAAISYRF